MFYDFTIAPKLKCRYRQTLWYSYMISKIFEELLTEFIYGVAQKNQGYCNTYCFLRWYTLLLSLKEYSYGYIRQIPNFVWDKLPCRRYS